jgi:5-methylthioadenosine/S-adenosylhomocysteine deaminase
MATIEGAKVLGLERDIGSVEPGKWADLILIDLDKPHFTPLYNLCSTWCMSPGAPMSRRPSIGGKIV